MRNACAGVHGGNESMHGIGSGCFARSHDALNGLLNLNLVFKKQRLKKLMRDVTRLSPPAAFRHAAERGAVKDLQIRG